MPIYMDVHIVPGVKAKDVAAAHMRDLAHQDEYGCKCMTYWVDEKRESIFCLVDAPEKDAIQWLLLRVKSHQGQGILDKAAFIRRTDTKGGVAPTAGCDASHVSEEVRMRYSAIYQFFSAAKG